MITVKVEGTDAVRAELSDIARNQLPYATAVAITRTLQDVQKVERNEVLPSHFVLRRAAWMKQNVRIQPATKAKLEGVVQDTFQPMELQESGGDKIPYGRAIAVPLSGVRPWGSRKLIPDDMRPQAIMERGGFIRNGIMYAVELKQGRRAAIRGVRGMQQAASWSRKIVPMYALVPRAKIPRRYGFEDRAVAVVKANWPSNFDAAFAKAVKTAR